MRRSRSAAQQARQTARAAREGIAHDDVIADLSTATATVEEIMRHQRQRNGQVLPDRCADLRRRVVSIRESHAHGIDAHRQTLQLARETFADLERRVERAVASTGAPPRPARLSDIVSGQIDEVHAVLPLLRRTLKSGR